MVLQVTPQGVQFGQLPFDQLDSLSGQVDVQSSILEIPQSALKVLELVDDILVILRSIIIELFDLLNGLLLLQFLIRSQLTHHVDGVLIVLIELAQHLILCHEVFIQLRLHLPQIDGPLNENGQGRFQVDFIQL